MVKVATAAPKNTPDDYTPYEGSTQWWNADATKPHTLQVSKKGLASAIETPPTTIPKLLIQAAKKNGNKPALRSEMQPPLKKGETAPPALPLAQWKTWTWNQYLQDSKKVAKAFIALGVQQFDSVTIFGFNSPEWALSLMGAVCAGAKAAGVYPTDTPAFVQYKCDHSNASVAVCQNNANLDKFRGIIDQLPYLKAIVVYEDNPGDDLTTSDGRVIKTLTWDDMMKLGAAQSNEEVDKRMEAVEPGHCSALIYTSGTTGFPKAVMVCHDGMVSTSCAVLSATKVCGIKKGEERVISYLPLSHIAGLMIDLINPLIVSSNYWKFKAYVTTYFARSYDLKTGTLVDRLKAVKPTLFLGVPRVWEKIMEKLKLVGASTKGVAKSISTFAKAKGAAYTSTRQLGGEGVDPSNYFLAKFVLGKIKQKLGLNKCKFMFSGAAPLTVETLEYFGSIGININEVYGMSETTGVVTWSTDEHHVWGSVGYEVPGVEVRILDTKGNEVPAAKDLLAATEAEQGEICFRGRNIMMGYLANPRLGDAHVKEIEQKNRDAIDENGFMHSGDKGTRDERGMVKITGRYKELIIGAGGENIAPVPIEDELKKVCPILSNVMMIGNKRKFNVMLVTLKAQGATGELPGTNDLAPPALGTSDAKTITEAMSDDVIIKTITDAITAVNGNDKVVPSNAAKVQKFTILPRDFSVQTDELTATLKLKRSVVEDQFEPIISKMYDVNDVYVNYGLAPTAGLKMGDGAAPVLEKNLSFNMNKVMDEAVEDLKQE